jgi:hypothetical protein
MVNMVIISAAIWLANKIGGGGIVKAAPGRVGMGG